MPLAHPAVARSTLPPAGSARPAKLLVQLWEDPNFAVANRMRVPQLSALQAYDSMAAAIPGRAARADDGDDDGLWRNDTERDAFFGARARPTRARRRARASGSPRVREGS